MLAWLLPASNGGSKLIQATKRCPLERVSWYLLDVNWILIAIQCERNRHAMFHQFKS